MQTVFKILIFISFLTSAASFAQAKSALPPPQTVRIVIDKAPAPTRNTPHASDRNTRLASFISGRIAPMLGHTDAHNVKSCDACAVVVQ